MCWNIILTKWYWCEVRMVGPKNTLEYFFTLLNFLSYKHLKGVINRYVCSKKNPSCKIPRSRDLSKIIWCNRFPNIEILQNQIIADTLTIYTSIFGHFLRLGYGYLILKVTSICTIQSIIAQQGEPKYKEPTMG